MLRKFSLAGGIATGAVSNARLGGPDVALLIGFFAAATCWVSIKYVDPLIEAKLGVRDVACANSCFGVPAL